MFGRLLVLTVESARDQESVVGRFDLAIALCASYIRFSHRSADRMYPRRHR